MDISPRGRQSRVVYVYPKVVLGPVLFLIFINDIDPNLLCAISKFADDTKLSNTVNCNKDRDLLQSDLERLVEWLTSK